MSWTLVTCVGDFHQLRPVKDSYVFQVSNSSSNNYDDLGSYLWEKFSFIELTQIMRQKDDQKFALELNNFANCCLTEEDINLFTSRIIQKVDRCQYFIMTMRIKLGMKNLSNDYIVFLRYLE